MIPMEGMLVSIAYTMAIISPEDLAGYLVTAFFTIINLLITYIIVRMFLFKPAIRFMKKRQEKVAADLAEAKSKRKEAEELLSEGKMRVERSTHEATAIVEDAKVQAEKQSGAIIDGAKRESIEIITRAHNDVELLKKAAMEEMRDEVADLSLAIAYKVVSQTMDDNKQRELVERFIGEEFEGKNKEDA